MMKEIGEGMVELGEGLKVNLRSEPLEAGMTDYIAEAITSAFGERCQDFMQTCPACEAWKQYDELRVSKENTILAERERCKAIAIGYPILVSRIVTGDPA